MDTTQLLLTIVLTITMILSIIIGFQVIFILRELRKTLKSINKIIEEFEIIGTGLEHGLSEVVGFLNGFKTLLKVVGFLKHKKNAETKQ